MTATIIGLLLFIVAFCQVAGLANASKDYFVVEWRALNWEGKDLLPKWESLGDLSVTAGSVLGFKLTKDGRVFRGKDWVWTRTLKTFDSLETAKMNYKDLKGCGPLPHFIAANACLWVVRARSFYVAEKLIFHGRGLVLEKSRPIVVDTSPVQPTAVDDFQNA